MDLSENIENVSVNCDELAWFERKLWERRLKSRVYAHIVNKGAAKMQRRISEIWLISLPLMAGAAFADVPGALRFDTLQDRPLADLCVSELNRCGKSDPLGGDAALVAPTPQFNPLRIGDIVGADCPVVSFGKYRSLRGETYCRVDNIYLRIDPATRKIIGIGDPPG